MESWPNEFNKLVTLTYFKIDVLLSFFYARSVLNDVIRNGLFFPKKTVFVHMIFFPFLGECLQVMYLYFIAKGERGMLTVQ